MSKHSHDPRGTSRRTGPQQSVRQRFGTIFRPAPFVPEQDPAPSRDNIPRPPQAFPHIW